VKAEKKKEGIMFIGIGIVIFIASFLMIPKLTPHLSLGDAYLWVYSTIAQAFAAVIALVAMFVVLAIQIWRTSRSNLIRGLKDTMRKGWSYACSDNASNNKTGSKKSEMSEVLKRAIMIESTLVEDAPDEEIVKMAETWVRRIKERNKKEREEKGIPMYYPGESRLLQYYNTLKSEEDAYNKTLILLKRSLLLTGCIIVSSLVMLSLSKLFASDWWSFSILINMLGWVIIAVFLFIKDILTVTNFIKIKPAEKIES